MPIHISLYLDECPIELATSLAHKCDSCVKLDEEPPRFTWLSSIGIELEESLSRPLPSSTEFERILNHKDFGHVVLKCKLFTTSESSIAAIIGIMSGDNWCYVEIMPYANMLGDEMAQFFDRLKLVKSILDQLLVKGVKARIGVENSSASDSDPEGLYGNQINQVCTSVADIQNLYLQWRRRWQGA